MNKLFKTKKEFKKAYKEKFVEAEGKPFEDGTPAEQYHALVMLIREKINLNWSNTLRTLSDSGRKQVYYFSMEFLIGRLLEYYLVNLDSQDLVTKGLGELGIDIETIYQQEADPGLGNGGLGRLAACFLDSMAFLSIPGHGNGMRYRFGLFSQKFVDGHQVEMPDNWLKNGYPWEKRKANKSVLVKFKGHVEVAEEEGRTVFHWKDYEPIMAVPYDVPIVSYDAGEHINNLRLWSAEPVVENPDLQSFNIGDYAKAMGYRSEAEAISYVLYPEDSAPSGRELRLRQEYLLVAAGIASIIRRYKKDGYSILKLPQKVGIHINDTHPALAVPELMRILIDEEGLSWEQAWLITGNTISFTNHTILPEALEKWPMDVVRYLLPRVAQIIEEIDRRYRLTTAWRFPKDEKLIERTAIIQDGYVHMANLAIVGSYSVNGVAALHTKILKTEVFQDFNKIYPYKFNNKTNGVSHRRFLLTANKGLAALISETVGDGWKSHPEQLEQLMQYGEDAQFLKRLWQVKYDNKKSLAQYIKEQYGIEINPESVFDVQVKRIHAYKRQLMNALKIMDLYNQLKENPQLKIPPCTFIFAGKAAPGYHYAKMVIKLINTIAQKVNSDPDIGDRMKVVFLENFSVSLGQMIYPAADISEQISTASQEASGTGNMKFMMNGAVTLGTLDGANVEICQQVGMDNVRIFGLTAEEVFDYQQNGAYKAWDEYAQQPILKRVVDQLVNGFFEGEGTEFQIIFDSLLRDNDQFFVLKDFMAYREAFYSLLELHQDRNRWMQVSLVNVAKSGFFSSDRAVKEYAKEIWHVDCTD